MKKLLFLALVLPAAGAVHAQEPNSILVYGSGYFSGSNDHSVGGGLGYQFNKHWTVGGLFSEAYIDQRNTMSPSLFRSYSLGVFARYSSYFGDSKRFFWYGQANISRMEALNNSFNQPFPTEDRRTGFDAKVLGGIGVNVWRGFSVNVEPASISIASSRTHYSGGWTGPTDRGTLIEFGMQPRIIFSKNFKIDGHKKADKPKHDQ